MIVNNSKQVEKIGFKDFIELNRWCSHNNVGDGETSDIIGYCEIVQELVIGHYSSHVEYVIKRFDGKKFHIRADTLERFFITHGSSYTIVNLTKEDCRNDYLGWIVTIIDKDKMTTRQHKPSFSMIREYLYSIYSFNPPVFEYETVKTKMKKEEFNNLVAKLRMIGAKFNIVDINTVGLMQGYKLLLYTRQKEILEDE
jgi:hypothetical protein